MTAAEDQNETTDEDIRETEITDDDVKEVVKNFIGTDDAKKIVQEVQTDEGETKYEFQGKFTVDYSDRNLWVDKDSKILNDGSTAIVINCYQMLDDYRREYALKFPRPSVLKGDEGWELKPKEVKGQRNEAMKQGRLSHPNVTYLIDASDTHLPLESEPRGTIMLQEWIKGAKPLDEYVYPPEDPEDDIEDAQEEIAELEELVELFIEMFRGLSHIHEKNLVHWDVKSGNCLVNDDGVVKINDVGNARERAGEQDDEYEEGTERYTSEICLPEKADPRIEPYEGNDRVRFSIAEDDLNLDKPWLDLYMAGRMMARICGLECYEELEEDIDEDKKNRREEFRDYVFKTNKPHAEMSERYLNIIAARLLKPFDGITFDSIDGGSNEGIRGDPDPYYEDGNAVADDLEKLLHEFGGATDVPELYPIPQESIRIPVTGDAEFSTRIEKLAKSSPGRRLREHKQLALNRFAYPGARNSRFEHILGVVSTTLEYIRALYSDRTNPTFRLLCDSRNVHALIFAAAVHDMGHVAFTHYLEEKEPLFRNCTHQDYMQAVLRGDPERYDRGLAGELSGHLAVDREELKALVEEDWVRKKSSEDDGAAEFMELVANILWPREMDNPGWDKDEDFIPDLRDRKDTEDATIWLLHSVIECAFDADKLDYLRRDAEHAGLDYPKGADVDRFLQSLTVTTRPIEQSRGQGEENGDSQKFRPTIAVNQDGVDPLESLLLARYQVHKTLYWHCDVRSAATVLNNQVWQYLMESSSNDRASSENSYNEAMFKESRRELLKVFRMENDEYAIDWLLDKRINQGTDGDVNSYSSCLLNCTKVPRPILNVRQGQGEEENGLTSILDANKKLHSLERNEYMDTRSEIISNTSETLKDKLVENGLDEDSDLTLGQGKLFIDVPLQSKDHPIASKEQIKKLYVVDRRLTLPKDESSGTENTQQQGRQGEGPDPLGSRHEVRRFEELSALDDEVKDAIASWARPIRVFVWEDDRKEILEAVDHNKKTLAHLVINSLHDAYMEEPPT